MLPLTGIDIGNNSLCRFAGATTHSACRSNVPELQLALLRFVPTLAELYLCRAVSRSRQAAGWPGSCSSCYAHAEEAEILAQRVAARHELRHGSKMAADRNLMVGLSLLLQCCSKVKQR
jgi:hypothetical protein